MSECISEITMIRLTAGELDVSEVKRVRRHIETCAACSARIEEFRGTWDLLGEWDAAAECPADLRLRVLSVAKHRPGTRGWLPLAAAIAIAAGVGVFAGRYALRGGVDEARPHVAASAEQVRETLGLDALGEDCTDLDGLFTTGEEDGEHT